MAINTKYYQDIIDKGISAFPLRKVWDEKKNEYTGKVSAIAGWNKFCEELPADEEVSSWSQVSASGVGYACGEASNLACIDIDTEDPELAKRIAEKLPYTPCRIMGNPKRYGKLLYRITDTPFAYDFNSVQKKQKVDKYGERVVDIFLGNSYVAAPPSIHSMSKDGSNMIMYSWFEHDLLDIGIENLPVIPKDAMYIISQIVAGSTSKDMAPRQEHNDVEGGRWSKLTRKASLLSASGVSVDDAVKELLWMDETLFPDGSYFLDKTKGCKTNSKIINAYVFYSGMMASYRDRGSIEEPKIRKDMAPLYMDSFQELKPLKKQNIELPEFDTSVIPTVWRGLCEDVSSSNGVPIESCLYILLTSLSSLIGNKRKITAKNLNKSWEEAFNIWTIYVSPSGTRKTQVLKTLTKYMTDLQKEIDEEYNKYFESVQKEETVKEERIKNLTQTLKKEISSSMSENGGKITPASQKEIDRIQNDINNAKKEAEIVPRPQLIAKGTTVEKLIEILGANKNGTLLEYNELKQLTDLFKKKGYESLRTLLLDSWDGLRSYHYQTKNSGEVFIEKNCTSLYGAIQNTVLESELREIALDINDDGFYQRAFFVINENPFTKAIDQEFDISSYSDAMIPFRDAYYMPEGKNVDTTQEAYLEYMQFEQKMVSMSNAESISALSSFWGKFTGKVVKIAALFEFLSSGAGFKKISENSMLCAIYLMNRQITHIRNMFPDPIIEHSEEVIRLVRLGVIKDGVDHEKLVRCYSPLKTPSICNKVCDMLYAHNVIDVKTRDSKYYYYFNPELKPRDSSCD